MGAGEWTVSVDPSLRALVSLPFVNYLSLEPRPSRNCQQPTQTLNARLLAFGPINEESRKCPDSQGGCPTKRVREEKVNITVSILNGIDTDLCTSKSRYPALPRSFFHFIFQAKGRSSLPRLRGGEESNHEYWVMLLVYYPCPRFSPELERYMCVWPRLSE